MRLFIIPQWISGMMLGIELLDGGLVLDLLIVRILFLKEDSPYIEDME